MPRTPLLFVPSFLLACSEPMAEPTAVELSEADYTVTPTGGTGQIKVSVPAGATSTRVFARRQEGGASIELTNGVAKPVTPGKYCIHTRVTGTSASNILFETQADCSLTVAAGATAEYALGAVQFERSRDELVFGLDVGKDREYAHEAVRRMMTTAEPIAHARGSFEYSYLFIRDGSYTATYRPLDTVSFAVQSNATTKIDLVDTNDRWAVRILPGSPRTLPNTTSRIDARVTQGTHTYTEQPVDIGGLAKPLLVRAKTQSNIAVTAPSSQTFALTQPMSDKKLARLDVENVQVSMPDGTTQTAIGTVRIGALTFPTNTGVDLLPGTYDLAVSYPHPADGAPVTTTITADLQP